MNEHEFEFNLNSPAFQDFTNDLNSAVLLCLNELFEGNFAGGEISSKIIIELQNGQENYPVGRDENGKFKQKVYHYKKPVIDYKVTLTLKRRGETKGSYEPNGMELKKDDKDRFILANVVTAQLSLYDYDH